MAERSGRQRVQDQCKSAKIEAQRRREWQSEAEDRVQDQWKSARIKAQRHREWQSKAEDRGWRDRTENSGTAQKVKAQTLGRHLPATLDTREEEGGFELAIGHVGGDGERRCSKVELSAQGSELRPKGPKAYKKRVKK
ncbi:hypothetical protein NDU88_011381 [Pleurodeles waltl]|uniref:Uncharacterized protein n=1 Tax=Pleurodeles waltl TaxID=8319 RepID=A0AAV7QZ05_PLEWA|nr:hypothetical protein NDU88_011381 [Pleurodeles waltl]